MTPVFVTPGEILTNKHGYFHHDDLIGQTYGSKVTARTSQAEGKRQPGWMHVLQPTAELWSSCVQQRTQIVQPSDQAIIVAQLWLRGGSVVFESGTGSGIFTTALARVVAPAGHVYSFEFNEHRAKVAKDEFRVNGLDQAVDVEHRDVCADGFPVELDGRADAVFLDVPNPWLAIGHAKRALRRGGRVCTYSPCIEQVQRNCAALEIEKFHSITTIEVRLRKFDVREMSFVKPVFTTKEDTIQKFRAYTARRALAMARKEEKEAAEKEAAEREAAEREADASGESGESSTDKEADGVENDGSVLGKRSLESGKKKQGGGPGNSDGGPSSGKPRKVPKQERVTLPSTSMLTACPVSMMRGHTAFLTFATRE
jgi:tRNA (adenine57-N1/adenine58-N1)-methyltransferase